MTRTDEELETLYQTAAKKGHANGLWYVHHLGVEDGKAKTSEALDLIVRYGGIDGAHHKAWVIDQVVRALTGDGYDEWVRAAKDGEDGPETYEWDEGIAP